MAKKMDPKKTGLALGILFAAFHAIWSVLVLFGAAEWIIDNIFYLHFISTPMYIMGFNIVTAIILIAVTFVVGYLFGGAFALIWNSLK